MSQRPSPPPAAIGRLPCRTSAAVSCRRWRQHRHPLRQERSETARSSVQRLPDPAAGKSGRRCHGWEPHSQGAEIPGTDPRDPPRNPQNPNNSPPRKSTPSAPSSALPADRDAARCPFADREDHQAPRQTRTWISSLLRRTPKESLSNHRATIFFKCDSPGRVGLSVTGSKAYATTDTKCRHLLTSADILYHQGRMNVAATLSDKAIAIARS